MFSRLKIKTYLALLLLFLILSRHIWLQLREIHLSIGEEFTPILNNTTNNLNDFTNGILPQFTWVSQKLFENIFKIYPTTKDLLSLNQNIITLSTFCLILIARILSQSWIIALFLGATLLSRGDFVSQISVFSLNLNLSLLIIIWLLSFCFFLQFRFFIFLSISLIIAGVLNLIDPRMLGLLLAYPIFFIIDNRCLKSFSIHTKEKVNFNLWRQGLSIFFCKLIQGESLKFQKKPNSSIWNSFTLKEKFTIICLFFLGLYSQLNTLWTIFQRFSSTTKNYDIMSFFGKIGQCILLEIPKLQTFDIHWLISWILILSLILNKKPFQLYRLLGGHMIVIAAVIGFFISSTILSFLNFAVNYSNESYFFQWVVWVEPIIISFGVISLYGIFCKFYLDSLNKTFRGK